MLFGLINTARNGNIPYICGIYLDNLKIILDISISLCINIVNIN